MVTVYITYDLRLRNKRININKQNLSVVCLHVVVLDDVTVHVNEAQEVQTQWRRQPAYHPGHDEQPKVINLQHVN